MKQQPSRLKYKKNHKIRKSFFYLKEQKKFIPYYGNYCLKAIEAGKLNYKQIEACRKSIKRKVKRYGEVSIRVFTSYSITKKSVGIRMGKGKGNHAFWICNVRAGQVICEVSVVNELKAYLALSSAVNKLPIKVKLVRINY